MKRFRLLTTKKIAPALVLNAGLKGVEILEKEFINVEPVINDQLNERISQLIGERANVVFTSKNAVSAISGKKNYPDIDWKIFCTDGTTKIQVEKAFGKEKIAGSAVNASELADTILQHKEIKKVVFLCGDKRLNVLPDTLRGNSVEVAELIVYKTKAAPEKIVDDYDAVAFFSPSAVESFFTVNTVTQNIFCLSVGRTTTEAIKKYTSNEIFTAEQPTENFVVDMAIKLSNKNY